VRQQYVLWTAAATAQYVADSRICMSVLSSYDAEQTDVSVEVRAPLAYLAATPVSVLSSSGCASAEDALRDSDSEASASAESIPRGLAEDNGSRDAITVPAGISVMVHPSLFACVFTSKVVNTSCTEDSEFAG